MPQDLTPPSLPGDPGANAAEVTSAQLLNTQLGAVISALGSTSGDVVAGLTAIASAITASIIGGSTGVDANRLLRSKGTSGRALQNSVVTLGDTGIMSGVVTFLIGFTASESVGGAATPAIEVGGLDSSASIAAVRYSNNVNPPRLILAKSRGTAIPTNTIVQSGDELGRLIFAGANGSSFDNGVELVALVDGTPGSSNDMPTMLEVRTTPNASATPVTRFTVRADGSTRFAYEAGFPAASLTDASTITWDGLTQQSAKITLTSAVGATRALGAPTNLIDGFTYILRVQQSSSGGNALTYNSVFKWPGGVAPVLSTAANAIDILTFVSDGTNMYGVAQKSFS